MYAGLDKPTPITYHTTTEPCRIWHRAGHRKEVGNVARLSLSSLIIAPSYALKVIVSFQRNHLSPGMKFYIRRLFDAPDQVARHCFGQSVRSNQHMNSSGRLRQKDCCLTGRVAAAHDHYFFTATQLGFQMRGPVIDTSTFKLREIFQL